MNGDSATPMPGCRPRGTPTNRISVTVYTNLSSPLERRRVDLSSLRVVFAVRSFGVCAAGHEVDARDDPSRVLVIVWTPFRTPSRHDW